MRRCKLIVCIHHRAQSHGIRQVDDVVVVAVEHMNGFNLVASIKLKHLVATDPSLLNGAVP